MRCEPIRTAISAELDGEEPPLPRSVVDAHLFDCARCRDYEAEARRLHRRFRIAAADAVPDLTEPVLAAIGEPAAPARAVDDRTQLLRWCLALIALVQLGLALPALLLGDSGTPLHVARHLGSFTLALGAGMLYVAWRPRVAGPLLPVVAVLVACLVGTSVVDVALGNAAASGEVAHVPEVAGLVAVWCLARRASDATDPVPPVLGWGAQS